MTKYDHKGRSVLKKLTLSEQDVEAIIAVWNRLDGGMLYRCALFFILQKEPTKENLVEWLEDELRASDLRSDVQFGSWFDNLHMEEGGIQALIDRWNQLDLAVLSVETLSRALQQFPTRQIVLDYMISELRASQTRF